MTLRAKEHRRRERGRRGRAGITLVLLTASACCAGLLAPPATGGRGARADSPPATAERKRRESLNPDREIVFNVERLGCTLVQGVGCGHLLSPTLAALDKMQGVSRSYSNWAGTRLRVSIAPTADREAVAGRARDLLAGQQYAPSRVEPGELPKALEGEEWRGVERIGELTSYEFRTEARRRIDAFARSEGLSKEKAGKLRRMVDELWEKSGEGKGAPPSDADGYPAYWNDRVETFKAALLKRAAEVLDEKQTARLAAEAAPEG